MKKDKKQKKRNDRVGVSTAFEAQKNTAWIAPALSILLALVAFQVYSPALRGPFLLDDLYLPFLAESFPSFSLREQVSGVRPVLMLSFKANYELSGLQPFGYHFLNLLLHIGTALLAGLIVRRYLDLAGAGKDLARAVAFLAGGLFLLHPLQTESVSYIASRSEALSVFLAYAAWAVFICRKSDRVGYRRAAAVILLYGLAVLTKEHVAVLPAIFILSDLYFRSDSAIASIKRNWRLYAPVTVAGAIGAAFIWRILKMSDTAGFGMKGDTWYDYFFTQCRAIWVYVRLFVFPVGQNVDPDFPLSRSVLQHGAIIGLVALLAWLGAAIYFRKRFPLASLGTLVFFVLLAPTSSFMPIADPMAERRMYLPMIGMLLIVAEFARRVKLNRTQFAAAATAVLVVCSILTWRRNHVWSSALALWTDTVEKSPNKARPHSQLAYAYYEENRCSEAAAQYEITSKLQKPDDALYVNWALAEDCAGNFQKSVDVLQKALALKKTGHEYATLGMFYAKHGDEDKAIQALDTAVQVTWNFPMTYVYRGAIYLHRKQFQLAVKDFELALKLNPGITEARQGLEMAQSGLRSSPKTDQ